MAFVNQLRIKTGNTLTFALRLTGLVLCCLGPGSAAAQEASSALPETEIMNGPDTLFISGHSLTGPPFPDYLAEIAASSGVSLWWNMQHLGGSSIHDRLVGTEANAGAATVSGSIDRFGQPLDLRQELAHPSSPGGNAYDALIITEQHRLLDSLVWKDMLPSLKRFQDEYAGSNPGGKTYFYVPWISLSDTADPQRWMQYEARALPVWRCVIEHVNAGLADAGRPDRIDFLPASTALVHLVERLWSGANFPGFETMDGPARLRALFSDDVHLTPLGVYYMSMVTFLWIYGEDGPAPLTPASIDPAKGQTLHRLAAEYVAATAPTMAATDCSTPIPLSFIAYYMSYTERTYYRAELGIFSSKMRQMREFIRFAWRFRNGLG